MRKIKFRAWDGEQMYFADIAELLDGYHCSDFRVRSQEVDEFILMQYTGLQDKNGKEIYEGDIVQLDPEHISEILFRDGGFGFIFCDDFVGFSGQLQLQEILKDFEILGTIYENPDLVECAKPTSSTSGR